MGGGVSAHVVRYCAAVAPGPSNALPTHGWQVLIPARAGGWLGSRGPVACGAGPAGEQIGSRRTATPWSSRQVSRARMALRISPVGGGCTPGDREESPRSLPLAACFAVDRSGITGECGQPGVRDDGTPELISMSPAPCHPEDCDRDQCGDRRPGNDHEATESSLPTDTWTSSISMRTRSGPAFPRERLCEKWRLEGTIMSDRIISADGHMDLFYLMRTAYPTCTRWTASPRGSATAR